MKTKKYILIFAIVCIIFFLTGCQGYLIGNVELNNITFPSAVSLDFSKEDRENVLVTIEAKKALQSEGDTGSTESYQVLKTEGRDVFEAERLLTTYSLKDINWGQNDTIVLGEDIARINALQHIDHFIRNHENRGTINILVAKGLRGEDIIEALGNSEDYVSDKVRSLFDDAGSMSIFSEINLYEFVSAIQNSYGGAVLPTIEISGLEAGKFNKSLMTKGVDPLQDANREDEQEGEEQSQGETTKGDDEDSEDGDEGSEGDSEGSEGGEGSEGSGESSGGSQGQGKSPGKMLVMTGYGVFKDEKLIGFLDAQLSRALNWVNDDVISTEVIAYDKNEEKIALEIINSKTKVKTKIKDDRPSVKIYISMSANIVSYHGSESIFDTENLQQVEGYLSNIVAEEVNAVISYAKTNNVDLFDFNGKLYRKHPLKWEKIKGNWDKIFPTLDVELEVESRISTTYNIKDPLRSEERKQK